MKASDYICLLFFCVATFAGFAQEATSNRFGQRLGVSVSASTMGLGVEVSTPVTRHLTLRGGLDVASLSHRFTIGVENNWVQESLGYQPDFRLKLAPDYLTGHLLLDLHPFSQQGFHLTVGLYAGKNKLDAEGVFLNPETGAQVNLPSGITWDGVSDWLTEGQVRIEDGKITGKVEADNRIKPYFGIGFGNSIPQRQLGVKIELGVLYQGTVRISQGEYEIKSLDFISEDFNNDANRVKKWIRLYPMIRIQLACRIL